MIKWVKSAVTLISAQGQLKWAMVDQALVSLANFLTGVLAARYLGIEEFGRFTLMWLVVQFAGNVQLAALNAPMMSIGPVRKDADKRKYYGSVSLCQAIFAVLAFIFVFIGMHLVDIGASAWRIGDLALPLASVTAGASLQDFFRRYFFTIGRFGHAFVIDVIRYVGQVAILAGLVEAGWDGMHADDILWILALASIAGVLPSLGELRRFSWSASQFRNVIAEHLHFGKWLFGSVLISWAQRSVFQIVAGTLLGAAAVGALKAVQMLMGVTQIFLQGLENVVPVEASRRFAAQGHQALARYLQGVAGIGGAVVVGTSLVFLAAPAFWLELLYGSEFGDYGHLVFWYLVAYLLAFLGVPLGAGLRTFHSTRPVFYSHCAGTLTAIVCAYPLTWGFGITGNAAGTALVGIVTQLVLWRSFRSKFAEVRFASQ